VVQTGDLPQLPEVAQPPRHFFDSAELSSVLTSAGLDTITLAAAPAIGTMLYDRLAAIEQDPGAWDTLLRIEEQASTKPGLLDSGEFLLAKGTVPGLTPD
jgi:hypothetical protein